MKLENMDRANSEADDNSEKQDSSISTSSRVELISENGITYAKDQCFKIFKRFRKCFRDAKVFEKLNCVMKYLLANPILLLGFIVITAVIVIPVVVFTVFAITNVAIAFTGFMIIEVMLLFIGLTILCCILFFVLSVIVVTGVSFVLSYYVTYSSYSLVKKKIQSK